MLRTSLALSLVTGTAFRMVNIRAGRARPGLMRQHLTAVQAAAEVGRAVVEGDAVGSRELTFKPVRVSSGQWTFSVGTAGSATLVFQTVLPALLTAGGASSLVLEGGTHNPLAPPHDFLAEVFLPLLRRMGPKVETVLQSHGFYPAGGGRFSVDVQPARKLEALVLQERGGIVARSIRVLVSQLPHHVGAREVEVLRQALGWNADEIRVQVVRDSRGPGNVALARLQSTHVTEVLSAFGEKGVPAEKVAEDLVQQVKGYELANVPVGEHLADQLMLPMALAGSGCFHTVPLTRHAQTQLELIPRFLDVRMTAKPVADGVIEVQVGGS